MPLHFQLPDPLAVHFAVVAHLAAVTIAGEREAVKAVAPLKARIARVLTGLHPAKERLKRLLGAAQDILAGGEIREAQAAIGPNRFELVGLVVVVQGRVRFAVGVSPLLKRGIVEGSGLVKLRLQGIPLFPCGIEAIAITLVHGLDSPLGLDICTNRALTHVPDCPGIVGPTPQRR
jgi:hypothetical protein